MLARSLNIRWLSHRRFKLRIRILYVALAILTALLLVSSTSYFYAQDIAPKNRVAQAQVQAPSEAIQKPLPGALDAAKAFSQAFVQVSKRVTPSIVMIMNEEKMEANNLNLPDDFFNRFFDFTPEQREQVQKTIGSGVIVSSDGYIITNNHVVDNSTNLKVTLPDGNRVSAKIIGTDSKTDLALIKVDATNLHPITLGHYKDIEVGEWVLAVGSPFGEALQRTVTAGIISAKGRSNVGIADYEDFLQTDAAINPGNSGGALVDLDGNLIGINTAIVSSNGSNAGVGFAIPINIVRNIMQQLKTNGRVIRGYMGVTIQDISPEIERELHLNTVKGAVVSNVESDSPAEKGGLKRYDVITSVNGNDVDSSADLRNAVSSLSPGSNAEIGYIRDGKNETTRIKVEELKSDQLAGNQNGRSNEKLGMQLQSLTPDIARQLGSHHTKGAVVVEVAQGSLADEAGIQRGDIILEVNRQPVQSPADFQSILRNAKDSSLLLVVERQGSEFFVTLQTR
jgi:serine protease Do